MFQTSSSTSETALPKLYRIRDVVAFVRLSEPAIWRQIKSGNFPRPIKIGARSVAWLEEDLLEWVSRRTAERDKLGGYKMGGDDASQH